MQIQFKNQNCNIQFGRYLNGRIAIQLTDPDNGKIVAVATTNLPDVDIDKNDVIITHCAEHIGLLETLVKAKIVSKPVECLDYGYANYPICKLLTAQYN